MAQLIADLKALQEAAAQGLITEDEHARERALVMAGPRSTPTPDGATAVQALTAVATALTQNAAQRVPRNVDQVRSPSPSPSPASFVHVPVDTCASEPSPPQPSSSASSNTQESPLLRNWAGLKRSRVTIETTGGHAMEVEGLPRMKKSRTAALPFQCRHCISGFKDAGDVASHMHYKHSKVSCRVGALTSFIQLELKSEVLCTFLMRDIVRTALDSIDFTSLKGHGTDSAKLNENHWAKEANGGKDGRSMTLCRSAEKRIARSWHFKKRVILEVDQFQATHPHQRDQAATFVAMMYDLTRNQVSDWKRSRF